MGIGNLADVVRGYSGPTEKALARTVIAKDGLTYAQVYFDSGPFHHATSYVRLQRLGDASSTYYWRVLAAREIMRQYRLDRARLAGMARLETSYGSAEPVIRPPQSTPSLADQAAIRTALARGTLRPVPDQPGARHFALDQTLAATVRQAGRDPKVYAALRPEALATLEYLAQRVHAIAHAKSPLWVAATVRDVALQAQVASAGPAPRGYSATTTGYAFDIVRRYATPAQAQAFQAMLDRLQALDIIAWERRPSTIHITVSRHARGLLPILDGAEVSDSS
jgi:hypothetical protein